MQHPFNRTGALSALLTLFLASSAAVAQYQSTNLDSDLAGKAKHQDTLLKNAWGLAYAPGGAFWVSDEASGWSTLYDGKGNIQSLKVVVPPATGTGAGSPTGMVYNGSDEFAIDSWVSAFLFCTLDGTIQGWSDFEPSTTLIGATSKGASYTGLAITNHSSGNSLFAADAANNKVDIYNGNFSLTGSMEGPRGAQIRWSATENTTREGVPTAAARCDIPLSLPTNTRAPLNQHASS